MLYKYVLAYSFTAFACALCAFVILLKCNSDIGRESEVRAFRACTASVIVYDAASAIWIWSYYGFLPRFSLLAAVSLCSLCFCGYFWFIYVIRRTHKLKIYNRLVRVLVALPLLVDVFMVALSPRTGWMFRYADDGTYLHGPFYALHLVLTGAYIAASFFHSLFMMLMLRHESKKSEARELLNFLLCPGIAFIIYVCVSGVSDAPIFELSLLVAEFAVFLEMQSSRIYTDALTGLNNRRNADKVLFAKIRQADAENPLYLFLMDVNKFKQINDGYGHVEGDRALKIMADALRKVGVKQKGLIARWGGDEFIMIIESQHLDSPDSVMNAIRGQLSNEAQEAATPYPITCSIGYAVCKSPDTSIAELTSEADAMLYENKKASRPPASASVAPGEHLGGAAK